ncbi:outer membrane beta-barrel protein [Candidatus Neomarinimicrobiota bacterium]
MILQIRYPASLLLAGLLLLGQIAFGSVHFTAADSSDLTISPPDTTTSRAGSNLTVPLSPADTITADPRIIPSIDPLLELLLTPGDEIPIDLERTSTRRVITAREIADLPVESITELISLQPGTVGAHVRGSRASDMEVYLDGISLRNPMTGYEGQEVGEFHGPSLHSSLGMELPDFAFSQVELLPGGFSTQYGNAGPAVVNLTTREGTHKHSGYIRLTTEGLYLRDWNGIKEREWYIDPTMHLPPDMEIESTYIVDQDGYGYHAGETLRTRTVFIQGGRIRIDDELVDAAGLQEIHANSLLDDWGREYVESTPIWTETQNDYDRTRVAYCFTGPLLRNAFYALSGEWLDQAKGRYENTSHQNYNVLGNLTFNISSGTRLKLTTLRSESVQGQYYHDNRKWQGGYWPYYGSLVRSLDTVNDRFRKNTLFTGVLTQALGPNAYINIAFGMYNSDFEQKRKDYDDRDGDGDRNEYLVFRKTFVPQGASGNPADTLLWRYTTEDEELAYIWTWDPTLSDSVNFPNTYAPKYRGRWVYGNPELLADDHLWSEEHKSGWKEVWIPVYDWDPGSWSYYSDWLFVTGDNQIEMTGVTHNDVDERILNVTDSYFHAVGDPYRAYLNTSSTIKTIKIDYNQHIGKNHIFRAGGEYLNYDLSALRINTSSPGNYYLDEWQRQPHEWALYLNDSFKHHDLQVEFGMRWDVYHLGDDVIYSAVADDHHQFPVNQKTDALIEPVIWEGPGISFSPSLGFAFPYKDRSVYFFRYSRHNRRPDWIYFYQNLDYNDQGAYPHIGNPELEPIQIKAYELGWTVKPRPDLVLDVTLFERDVLGWVQMQRGGELPGTKFRIPTNDDYGNSRGIELAVTKNYRQNTSLNLFYTYMVAKGRLSDPGLGGTYLWRQFIMPRKMVLTDYDQKHTLQLWLNLDMPPNRNPYLLFGNWKASVVYRYGSGLPFNSQSYTQSYIIPPENDLRRPHTKTVDLHLAKRINLPGSVWSIWIDVLNVFNEQNLIAEPDNAEWYLSKEDLDRDGNADHYRDPEGRYRDWTVWGPGRRVKVGMDIEW